MYRSATLCTLQIHLFWPNRPRNEKNPPEKIMHRAVKFIGALIVRLEIRFYQQQQNSRGLQSTN